MITTRVVLCSQHCPTTQHNKIEHLLTNVSLSDEQHNINILVSVSGMLTSIAYDEPI